MRDRSALPVLTAAQLEWLTERSEQSPSECGWRGAIAVYEWYIRLLAAPARRCAQSC